MATTQPYLEITDGVTSVKIMDSTATTPAQIAALNYRLSFAGWAPKVARISSNPLGLPYMPVQEEMTIDIKGATPDIVYNKLQVLNSLLDQGERWYNNEVVLPVFVRYQPLGSAKTTYMSDVVFGGMADDSNSEMITLPDDFNLTGNISFLKRVRLRFWRRNGVWQCETETLSNTGVAQGTTGLVTWSDFAPVLSPIDIEIGGSTADLNTASGFTMVAHDDTYIKVFLGTALLGSGTNTNDAANFPTGAQMRRFASGGSQTPVLQTLTTMPIKECEYYAVYAKVRNNSTTVDMYIGGRQVYPEIRNQEVKVPFLATPIPIIVFLGIFPTRGRTPGNIISDEFQLDIRAASGTLNLDIDSIAVVMLNRASNVINGNNVPHDTLASGFGINIRNRMLAEPQATYALNPPPTDAIQSYSGSAYCFTGGIGTTKKAAVLEYFTDQASWNILNTARSAKINLDYRVTRLKAYLVPE